MALTQDKPTSDWSESGFLNEISSWLRRVGSPAWLITCTLFGLVRVTGIRIRRDVLRAIEHHCDEQGLRLLRFYIDDAISGTSTVGRHAFQSMIEDAGRSACDFGFIVVYDVKRFGRIDNDEAGYYRHILRTHGVDVIYVSENFNGDGTDDLLRPVKQWQAREESKDLAKVTIRGLLSKAASNGGGNANGTSGGGWMGGAPPFGYDLRYESQSGQFLFSLRYMRDGSKEMFDEDWKLVRTLQRGESVAVSRRDRCVLVPSERSRAETVRRIFAMYVEEGRGPDWRDAAGWP